MKRIKFIFFLLIAALLAGAYFVYDRMAGDGLTIKISEKQINQTLAEKFPVEKEYLVLNTRLHQPEVHLNAELDRMEITLQAEVTTPKPLGFKIGNKEIGIGKETHNTATAVVAGKVDYDPSKATFYFKDAEVISVEANAEEEAGEYQEKVLKAVSFVARQMLNRIPVYRLNEVQAGSKAARLLLDEVQVLDGKLLVTLKLP